MAIVFYYAPMSSATRVYWALEELGVPFEKVKLDLRAGDQRKPDFLAVNPNGQVPALVDDGTPMFESLAILLHLGERYGVAKGLWPEADSAARMQAMSWLVWSEPTFGQNVHRLMYNTSDWVPAEQHNAGQAEAARRAIAGNLRVLEGHLEGRDFLLGEGFSLADVAVASVLSFARRMGADLTGHPRVEAYVARCESRAARARAVAG